MFTNLVHFKNTRVFKKLSQVEKKTKSMIIEFKYVVHAYVTRTNTTKAPYARTLLR